MKLPTKIHIEVLYESGEKNEMDYTYYGGQHLEDWTRSVKEELLLSAQEQEDPKIISIRFILVETI